MDEHTILADDENFGNVVVCPGGVVHVNLTHCSLKFVPEDFLKFSELIDKARRKYEAPQLTGGKPRLRLVASDADEQTTIDEKE